MVETLRTLTTKLLLVPVNLVKLDSRKCTWVRIYIPFSSMHHLTDPTPIPLILLCLLPFFLLFFLLFPSSSLILSFFFLIVYSLFSWDATSPFLQNQKLICKYFLFATDDFQPPTALHLRFSCFYCGCLCISSFWWAAQWVRKRECPCQCETHDTLFGLLKIAGDGAAF